MTVFTIKITIVDAQAAQPGGAVKGQGGDGGGEGGGGFQRVIGLREGRPWRNTFLDHHNGRWEGGREERKDRWNRRVLHIRSDNQPGIAERGSRVRPTFSLVPYSTLKRATLVMYI